ncbi:hypothetical protein PAXRUDRAFT_161489, partial [Paxillus rubicundulus Ve08.2h10]
NPVSTAMWITPKGEAQETLGFGTGLSYLVFWRQSTSSMAQFEEVIIKQVGTGCEITSMACGTSMVAGVCIATATREHNMMVWTFNNNVLTPTLSVQLNVTVPKGITFVTGQDVLYVWGMYNVEMHTIWSDGWVVKTASLSTAIGGVMLHDKQLVFAINNVTDGFSLHSVETRRLIRSYSTRLTVCKPKQVAFGEKGFIIIEGSESRVVYVFDHKTGHLIQMLHHVNEGLV